MEAIIKGRVDNFASSTIPFVADEPECLETALKQFSGKDMEIVVRARKKAGTDRQRKYYFKIIIGEFFGWLGYGKDDGHCAAVQKFLTYEDDYGFVLVKRYSQMTTKEREKYHREIREWAWNSYEYLIPLPNEVDF